MTFSSPRQIYCRCCGKAIAKWTYAFAVKKDPTVSEITRKELWRGYTELRIPVNLYPRTKADCQRLVNDRVVSLSYHDFPEKHIVKFTTWDGLTYADRHFCSGSCARDWGYLMADKFPEVASNAYRVATAGAKAKDAKA